MDVEISTSDPDNVDPVRVKDALEAANFFVLSVSVNEGERVWNYDPDEDEKYDPHGDDKHRFYEEN